MSDERSEEKLEHTAVDVVGENEISLNNNLYSYSITRNRGKDHNSTSGACDAVACNRDS